MSSESNLLSWHIALEKGCEPRLYSYKTEHIPLGEYKATLDFKIWAKKASAISCYLTQKDTNVRFQLTVYRRQKDKQYKLDNNDLDFKVCPVNIVYLISVHLNGKQNPTLKNAAFCTH